MGEAGQLCGKGKRRTQTGQKSADLLFHDIAETLIFRERRMGHSSVKKMEVIMQLQVQLEPSCINVANRGMINSRSVGYGNKAKEPRV